MCLVSNGRGNHHLRARALVGVEHYNDALPGQVGRATAHITSTPLRQEMLVKDSVPPGQKVVHVGHIFGVPERT